MAIAFVQKVTFLEAAVNTSVNTLNGVASGSFLALCVSVYLGSAPPNATPTDDKSNTWNTTTAPTLGVVDGNAFIDYAMNVASGNTAVTVDYGTGYYTAGSLSEFSGVATSAAIDQETSNGSTSSGATSSGTTGTTTQADELILACLSVTASSSNLGATTPATTGYTSLHVNQDGNTYQGHESSYKIVAATGTQAAAWGTVTFSSWSAKIATFKAGAAAPPADAYLTMPPLAPPMRAWR